MLRYLGFFLFFAAAAVAAEPAMSARAPATQTSRAVVAVIGTDTVAQPQNPADPVPGTPLPGPTIPETVEPASADIAAELDAVLQLSKEIVSLRQELQKLREFLQATPPEVTATSPPVTVLPGPAGPAPVIPPVPPVLPVPPVPPSPGKPAGPLISTANFLPEGTDPLTQQVWTTLQASCAACHSGPQAAGKLALFEVDKTTHRQLTAGMLLRLDAALYASSCPRPPVKKLSDGDYNQFRKWMRTYDPQLQRLARAADGL